MKPVERFVAALTQLGCEPRPAGNGWSALCPAHDDRQPSLSVAEGDDGRVLVICHAGCAIDPICNMAGLRVADLMPSSEKLPSQSKSKGKARIVAEYGYCDEVTNLLFQVVRSDPKGFRQRRPKPGGGWEWSVKGVRVVPYRLPELLADPKRPVFIVEGEKDVEALARLGLVATCNAGGAGKWIAAHSEFLRGRIVFIIPDNDDAGRKHAQQVAQSLRGIAKEIRIVELPGLPEKGDVSDWIETQPDAREPADIAEELQRLADAAPAWLPTCIVETGPILTCMADVEPRPVSWLWPGRIPLGRLTLLVGRPGEGKSFVTIDAAARVTTGTPWPDGSPCPLGSSIFISAEDDPADTIRPRLDAHYADVAKVHLLSAVRRMGNQGQYERMITLADVDAIERALVQLPDCKLIVVDPIGSFLGGNTDSHRDNEVRSVLTPIAKLAEKFGVAVLVVAHRRKSAGSSADDLALGSRAFTGIARAVWHLTRDPGNKARRLFLPGKNNLALEGIGLAFTIVGEQPRISWERDPVSMSADDALAVENNERERKPGPDADAQSAAIAWLNSALADGPRLSKELCDEWKNGHAGSTRTLERAKSKLQIVAFRTKVPGQWSWRLPDKVANLPSTCEAGDLGGLAENTLKFEAVESNDAKSL